MATSTTKALLIEQDEMVSAIQEEIIEFTGSPISFGFTENIFFIHGRVWHEFKIHDDTQLLMYAFIDDRDNLHTVNELSEARDFVFPEM